MTSEMGIELNSNPEAKNTFSTSFEAIEARFDMSCIDDIKICPSERLLDKMGEENEEIQNRKGGLIAWEYLERQTGLQQFASRFLPHGRFWCNAEYAALCTGKTYPPAQ